MPGKVEEPADRGTCSAFRLGNFSLACRLLGGGRDPQRQNRHHSKGDCGERQKDGNEIERAQRFAEMLQQRTPSDAAKAPARSRIATSGQSRFQRETVEGCTPARDAAALSDAPVSRITAQSKSSIGAFNPLGRPRPLGEAPEGGELAATVL